MAPTIIFILFIVRVILALLFDFFKVLLTFLMFLNHWVPNELYEIWKIIRNFTNLFFILVLIIMAFGTIFDIEKYSFRKMFVPFLIAALLINFSYPIGTYIVGVADNITGIFLKTTQDGLQASVWDVISVKGIRAQIFSGGKDGSTFNIGGIVRGATCVAASFAEAVPIVGQAVSFAGCAGIIVNLLTSDLFLLVGLFAFLAVAVFLLLRIPWLWILLITSPFAWLGLALPNLRKFWSGWWEHFLSWAFWPSAYMFVLMILTIILKVRDVDPFKSSAAGFNTYIFAQIIGINDIIFFIVTILFLIGGIWASFKVGKLFKGGAGWAAGVAQNAVKAIPIPKGRNEAGKMVFTSIADQERGAKQTWKRFVQQGPPEKGPLGWMRNFYTGTRGQEQGGKEAAKFMQERVLGYGPDVEAEKEKLKDLDHEVTILENKIDIGEIKPEMDEIKEEIRLARGNLFTALGSIDTHMLANYMTLAKKGDLDEKQTREVLRTLTATDPLLAKKFMETATKSNLQNLDTLQKLNVGVELKDKEGIIQPAMLQGPKAQAAQKEYYRWMISEEGQKFTRKIKPEDAIEYDALQKNFNQGMKIFGGQTTNEGKGFLKAWANAHPEMVVDYIASNRDGKTKSEDLNAEKLWRDYLPTDLKVVADLPQNVWNNPDFQAAFTEKRLKGRDVAGLNRIAQLMAEYITDDKKQAAFSQLLKAARDIAESTKKTAEAAAETAEGGGTSGRPRVPIIDTFDEFGRKL